MRRWDWSPGEKPTSLSQRENPCQRSHWPGSPGRPHATAAPALGLGPDRLLGNCVQHLSISPLAVEARKSESDLKLSLSHRQLTIPVVTNCLVRSWDYSRYPTFIMAIPTLAPLLGRPSASGRSLVKRLRGLLRLPATLPGDQRALFATTLARLYHQQLASPRLFASSCLRLQNPLLANIGSRASQSLPVSKSTVSTQDILEPECPESVSNLSHSRGFR